MSALKLTGRRGVTLIEMLVVISILVLLMAAAIPAMRVSMEGRDVREAARGINTFMNAARIRSKETGQSCGVLLERNTNVRQASIVLRQIDIPPLYTGDDEGSRVRVAWDGWLDWDASTNTGQVLDRPGNDPGPPPTPEAVPEGYSDPAVVAALRQTCPLLLTIYLQDAYCRPIFRPGDRIRVSGYWATILPDLTGALTDPSEARQVQTTILQPPDLNAGFVQFVAPATPSDPGPMRAVLEEYPPAETALALASWPDDDMDEDDVDGDTADGTTDWTRFTASSPMPFAIDRQPAWGGETVAYGAWAEPLHLTGNAAVDLAASGTDRNPTLFAPFRDFDIATAGDQDDDSPVIFIFSPDGSVERVYHHGTRERLVEPFYLLIGTRDRMVKELGAVPAGINELPQVGSIEDGTSIKDGGSNWLERTNLWVVINPLTGRVSVSENGYIGRPEVGDSADDLENELTTRGLSTPFNYYTLSHRQVGYELVRQYARAAQDKGGR